jgi:uroporphyrinogen-III synthase
MNLAGTRVLVTRPEHQADKLATAIRDAQGIAVLFPVLSIDAASSPHDAAAVLSSLGEADGVDFLIFLSPNAVENALDFLPPQGRPARPTQVAIGQATAQTMESVGLCVDLLPTNGHNSESLLEMAELQDVAGKHIIIVRGEGGRPLLGDTLRERGADVAYAEVYARKLPDVAEAEFDRLCDEPGIDLCIATSNEALENLCTMAGEAGCTKLREIPLLVVSKRAADLAAKLQFHSDIIIADGATDDALLSAIHRWKQQASNA